MSYEKALTLILGWQLRIGHFEVERETWNANHLHKHPGGNLGHKHKSIKFDVVRVRTATKYIKVY